MDYNGWLFDPSKLDDYDLFLFLLNASPLKAIIRREKKKEINDVYIENL